MHQEAPNDFVLERLRSYAASVESTYVESCLAAVGRFPDYDRLLCRFRGAVANFERGISPFGAVDEAHNELCVAMAILACGSLTNLSYEPRLPGSRKTIDFRVELGDGQFTFVDVKTIRPKSTDRWDKYEQAMNEKWFPPGVVVDLAQYALGGEIWHDMTAARGRILQYTLELEKKIAECSPATTNARFILALCSDGFRWHQDELEDFVAFYTTGRHRSDDSLGRMERNYMREQSLRFSSAVHGFAWICRPQREIRPTEINWNVQPPQDPAFAKRMIPLMGGGAA